ncbi:MAG: hypothetical protein NTV51_14075 [Verrucomicrobia bacterium]|nr:hypothetical protein [Verrucomicrobiota bacterium]
MTSDETPQPPPLAPANPVDEALLTALTSRGENTAPSGTNWTLVATGVLFITLGGMNWGWEYVLLLTLAVALHELGHVLAMRIFDYKNVRMLFIPLFGGLATGEPRELDATKNAIVALAGPLFGLLTGVLAAGVAYSMGSPPWLVKFAWVSLLLNGFNLIPFVPLDGGQLANEALFSRYPILELIFRLIALAGLSWLAWIMQAWLLGVVIVFMLMGSPLAYRRACIIRDARRDPAWQTRSLDLESATRLRGMVADLFPQIPRDRYPKNLVEHAHGMWLGLHKKFPGPGKTVALLGAYAFTVVILVPGLAIFLVRCFERPAM